MADDRRDIYHTDGPQRPANRPPPRVIDNPHEAWRSAVRENRMSLVRFWVVAIAFVALIGTILWQQVKLQKAPRNAAGETTSRMQLGAPDGPDRGAPAMLDEFPAFPRIDALYNAADVPADPGRLSINTLKSTAKTLVEAEQHFQAKNWAAAGELYQRAREQLPEVKGIAEYLAICQLQQNKHHDAIATFREALRDSPDAPGLLNNLASAHLVVGDLEAAESVLDRCVSLRPRYAKAYYNLGWLHLQRGEAEQAVGHLRTLLQLTPDDRRGLQMYAHALFETRQWKDASVALREVAAEHPQSSAVLFKLAHSLAQEGQHDDSVKHLRAAVDLVDLQTARARLDEAGYVPLRDHVGYRDLVATLDTKILVTE